MNNLAHQRAVPFEEWLAAIESGDGDTVIAGLSSDIVFEAGTKQASEKITYLGCFSGKSAVVESFQKKAAIAENVSVSIISWSANADCTFVQMKSVERTVGTGISYEIESTHIIELDELGLISRWKVLLDPTPEIDALKEECTSGFYSAIRNSDLPAIENALASGVAINAFDPDSGMTPLMIACCQGDVGVVKRLISAGALVNLADSGGGAMAIHKAAQSGSTETVRALVEAGAFVNSVAGATGHTPLMEAIWFGSVDVVELLLESGASLTVRSSYGFSLLEHFQYEEKVNADQSAEFKAMKDLIDARMKRDEDAVEHQKLMKAVVDGNLLQAQQAIDEGADVNETTPILGSFNDGHTPLHVASRDGKSEIVQPLIDAGANVNAVEPTFKAVPLHKAVYNGHADITAMLVNTPGIDLNFQGKTNGYSPLHDAIWHSFADCADILIKAGARLDTVGHDGRTPLDLSLKMFGPDHPTTKLIQAHL